MASYMAASAAAVAGLMIQTPNGAQSIHSPPYPPSPHSAPATSGAMLPSPPPPAGPPGSSPDAANPPSLHRPHSLDETVLSPHTPWVQTRTQSRLPGMADLSSPAKMQSNGGMTALGMSNNAKSMNGLPNSMNGMGVLQLGNGGIGSNGLQGNGMNNMSMTHNHIMNTQLGGGQMAMGNIAQNIGGGQMVGGQMGGGQMVGGQMGGGQMGGGQMGGGQMGGGQMGVGGQMGGGQMGSGQMGGGQMGIVSMGGMQNQRPPMPQLTAEQHRVRFISNLVMERLCVWGEYRTVSDWPQELVAHGSMPAIAEALQASPTHSLTIPQLVTAVKERTGNAHGGKALDMLNLKAYVRCFPALFHLRSGRTAAGRPLDVVELRIEFNDGMMANQQRQRYGVSGLSAVPPPPPPPPLPGLPVTHSMQGVGQQTSGQISGNGGQWTQLSARSALPQVNSNTSSQIGCPVERTASAPPAAPGCLDYNQVQAPSPSPTPSNSSSTLQPKELFASEGEGGSPRSLWSSPSLPNSFSLFGTAFSNNGSGVSSPAASPQAVLVPGEKSSFPAGATALVDTNSFADSMPNYDAEDSQSAADAETDEPLMLAQIDALFSGAGKDEEVTTAPAGLGEPGPAARAAYVKRFQLDRIFAAAVDRAMRHQVASPVEFIAHELLRHGEQQALPNTA